MNKLFKTFLTLIMAAALVAMACGLAACSCGSTQETTSEEAVVTLPENTFDDLSEADRLKQAKDDIDTIDELQKSGVDTDEKKAAYELAVEDLLDIAPEYKDIIEEGREDYNIDIEELNKKHAEESSAYESESASLESEANSIASDIETGTDDSGNYTLPVETDENGDAEVIELPTIRIQ